MSRGHVLDPDEWWHSLPIERRRQIYRWVEQPVEGHAPTPGQAELFPGLDAPAGPSDRVRRRGRRHSREGAGG